jgi:pyridoxal phosphate enzyme (YggS family)
MDFPGLPARLAAVRDTVARHKSLAGWSHEVTIVGVTKTHGVGAVHAAFAAGLTDVGENRVQEALQKQDALQDLSVAWHLVGTLQRNKARHAAGRFELIHSIDRIDLGAELDRRISPERRQRILVQVNCSDEMQKGGVAPQSLFQLLDQLGPLEHLEVRGLMTMSALNADAHEQRRSFRLLRELRDQAERSGHLLPVLSMGMSGDYPIAIEEGATMIRLGTVLFGERES